MKRGIKDILNRTLQLAREKRRLHAVPALPCGAGPLRSLSPEAVKDVFRDAADAKQWQETEQELLRACPIEDGTTGGVNPGDRRALWHLVRSFSPRSVLEVGTHVGASTAHMVKALDGIRREDPSVQPVLTTVDIQDVNDPVSGYWKQLGLNASPRDMMEAMGCSGLVTFQTETSLSYLDRCTDRYDFIFLDGDHAAPTVYQEIPRALKVLADDGVILLHDYFPGNRPLWSDGAVVPGPYLAVDRLEHEGAPVQAIPLGALPWSTKLDSTVTSLALLTRRTYGDRCA